MEENSHILSWLTFTPLIGAIVIALLPKRNESWARGLALSAGVLALLEALSLWWRFDGAYPGLQFVEQTPWIAAIHVDYFVGVDGLSILMVLLTALLTPVALLASSPIRKHLRAYYALMLALQTGLFGVFTSLNFFSDNPDERCTNDTYAAEVIQRDYFTVTTPPCLGDLILFRRGPDEIIHSCNYIADGIVFTKNGGSLGHPWMFARLSDLMDFYSQPTPVRISFMRRRDLPAR